MLINSIDVFPKPEGMPPIVVSSDIFIYLAYPVHRDLTSIPKIIKPLGERTADASESFFKPDWSYRLFEKEWLCGVCESGPSAGYKITYLDRGLRSHPLASMGLTPGNVFELVDSPWLHELKPTFSALLAQIGEGLPELKHYIFAFNDTLFECAATHFVNEYVFGDRYEVSSYIAASAKWGQ